MSRIGKKIIEIPAAAEVSIEGSKVSVKGPKGAVVFVMRPEIEVAKQDNHLTVVPKQGIENLEKSTKALWGTTRQILFNMVKGVCEGYEKKLEIEGVGYRAVLEGDLLALYVGFTNPVKVKIPEGVKVLIDKNVVSVSGPAKEKVGQFAAEIRKARPAEPYKGKGIKYQGEQIRRKLGKRAAVTAGAAASAK